jgi:hypothetical protein
MNANDTFDETIILPSIRIGLKEENVALEAANRVRGDLSTDC